MAPYDPDSRLHQLHLAAERITNNLVELEIDPSRQLLEASRLEGRSAERWSAGSGALTELWRRRGLLEGLLEQADGLRDRDALRSLLEGPSIELSDGLVPLAERHLLATARVAERCSAEELLTWMAAAFDEVKDVLAELTGPWDALTPRLDAARRVLAAARKLADELGESGDADLESAAETLQRVTARLTSDPLSVSPQAVEAVQRELYALRDGMQEACALQRDLNAKLEEARERLQRLRTACGATQAAHEELVLKVVLPSPPEAPSLPVELAAELDSIAELPQDQGWREASRALTVWTETADSLLREAQRALDANRAPIQARNQFRGLLEAYQVKAQRLGLLEDRELQDLFGEAHEALYTAPTDLARAAQLVRSYQIALSSAEAPREATP